MRLFITFILATAFTASIYVMQPEMQLYFAPRVGTPISQPYAFVAPTPSNDTNLLSKSLEANPSYNGSTGFNGDSTMTSDARTAPQSPIQISSRVFAGYGQIPPQGFKAYGILAFPARATPDTEARYQKICQAFIGTIPHSSEVDQAIAAQIVTIWPMTTVLMAQQASGLPRDKTCALAVEEYGLAPAQLAIQAARVSGNDIGTDRGPFLLAWAPGETMGKPGARMIIRDLSLVVTERQAKDEFFAWVSEIQSEPGMLPPLPWYETLRRKLRVLSDYNGQRVVDIFGLLVGKVTGENDDA